MIPPLLARWLTVLRLVLAGAIVWLSIPTAFPTDASALPLHGLGGFVRGLAGVEIAGAALLLVPGLVRLAGWTLIAVFTVAIALHALHGDFRFAALLIYMAGTAVVLAADHVRRAER